MTFEVALIGVTSPRPWERRERPPGRQASVVTAGENKDPRTWTLDVDPACIDLYLDLSDEPRPLTAAEAQMMVDLVDSWRMHEQRKHMALMDALHQLGRLDWSE